MKKHIILAAAGLLMFSGFANAVVQVESSARVETEGFDSARVLPTVNKVEVEIESELESKNDSQEDSQRLLPTVNKKTTAKVTVRGWDTEKKEAIQAKIDTELEKNEEIRSVELSENTVVIVYAAPAKLFGFIPMTMNMNVESDAEARVKVRFPWYRFMVSTYFSNTAEIINTVFQNNQTNLEFLKTRAAEDKQVEIFIQMSNSLKAMRQMQNQSFKI